MIWFAAALALGYQFEGSHLEAKSWPEADAMFQRDPSWIGGDSAYSIDLGHGRVVWLFGDSFIANTAARSRREATMVRNSLAIQSGYDVNAAHVRFYWHRQGAKASSFFDAARSDRWYWPGHGSLVGKRLILFLWEEKAGGGLGFSGTGWRSIAIENPSADPMNWSVTELQTSSRFPVLMGASVLVKGKYLYAYAGGRERPDPTYLARWPVAAWSTNSPGRPDWWAGSVGWVREADLVGEPTKIADVGQSEFTVAKLKGTDPFLLVQTHGFGAANLAFQTTKSLTSKYSGAKDFYSPPEKRVEKVMIYSAKMHPMLKSPGFEFVASYSTNSFEFNTLQDDMTLYFPRFVRCRWLRNQTDHVPPSMSRPWARPKAVTFSAMRSEPKK